MQSSLKKLLSTLPKDRGKQRCANNRKRHLKKKFPIKENESEVERLSYTVLNFVRVASPQEIF